MSGSGSSHGSEWGYPTLKAQQPEVEGELEGHNHHHDDLGKRTFVGKVASDEDIHDFLKSTDLYDTEAKRWRPIKREPYKDEPKLYGPILAIIQGILQYFDYADTRSVVNTHNIQYKHVEGREEYNPPELTTSPDMAILGSGDNFNPEAVRAGVPSYEICASPVEIKTQKNYSANANLVQIAIYVRQLFVQQSNRKFVYCPIITEKYVRLYIFDRSGAHVHNFSPINIHEDAIDFVRIILGVSSPDDSAIGFDTSICWTGDKRILKTLDEDKNPVTLTLESEQPIFYRRTIRGCGTCCWKARDNEGKVVLVKDAWRSRGRTPEWKFLEAAKGLAGIGQMISYEDNDDEHISTARRLAPFVRGFYDRTFCRLTLEHYGPSIEGFKTPQDVLFAYRDAIAGHQNLWNKGILHRDVSINNILIGRPGSPVGYRGVIIDLDMAIWINVKNRLVMADVRTGTRAFQSINVLESYDAENMTQDHLDDLESFYYVLCWICLGYSGPKNILDPFPPRLVNWEQGDAMLAADAKEAFLQRPLRRAFTKIAPFFGPVFLRLLGRLHSFFGDIRSVRFKTLYKSAVQRSDEETQQDYATILGFIDQAIEELAAPGAATVDESESSLDPSTASPPTTPTTTRAFSDRSPLLDISKNVITNGGSPSLKRPSAYPDEESPKRSRNSYAPKQTSSLSVEHD
ncbi:hypothetical protein BDZ97DRAFT_1674590 [Flammula alnicola]|nr:hypothetical protein BDZ97DRAFT_1674590 [Flammula alnicola]